MKKSAIVYIDGYNLYYGPRKEFHKNVIVLNPHVRRSDLEQHASYYKDIPVDAPRHCQLPCEIPIGTHGSKLTCPPEWQPPPSTPLRCPAVERG